MSPIDRSDWTEAEAAPAAPAPVVKEGTIQRPDWGESTSDDALTQQVNAETESSEVKRPDWTPEPVVTYHVEDVEDGQAEIENPLARPDWDAPPQEEPEADQELDAVQKVEAENFTDQDLIQEWSEDDGDANAKLDQAQNVALAMLDGLDDVESAVLERSFGTLDDSVQRCLIRELSMESMEAEDASEELVQQFSEEDPGMYEYWGEHAAKNLGIVLARFERAAEQMPEHGQRQMMKWYDGLSVEQQHGIMRALVQ